MIIHKPHLLTRLQIWSPRYHDGVVLISQFKTHHASPVILVEFTKAKSLKGQRFCIKRETVEHCPVETNGKIECYAVPMDLLEGWETAQEVRDLANSLFED